MWAWSYPEEAKDLEGFLKERKIIRPWFGSFNHKNLLIYHDNHDGIIGALYFFPDSFCTVLFEVWLSRPELCNGIEKAISSALHERGWSNMLIGYVDTNKMPFVNTLVRLGATIAHLAVQLDWRPTCSH